MKYSNFILSIIFFLFYHPCQAQYDKYYEVDNNTYITALPNAELYELSPSNYNFLIKKPSYNGRQRDLIDLTSITGYPHYGKVRKIKKPQQLRVLRYTNTIEQQGFNAYIVEYKEKLWVLCDRDVFDNKQLLERNEQIHCAKQNIEIKQQSLKSQLDSLVAIYSQECRDSLNHYQALKIQLTYIRDSMVNVVKTRYQQQRDSVFDNWLRGQTTSVKRAASILRINDVGLKSPDLYGGCDYIFDYTNVSSKTIKYLHWTGIAYNRVDDPVHCIIRRSSVCSGVDTGPVASGDSSYGGCKCVIYNYSADTIKLSSVRIDYTDGTSVNLSSSDIRALSHAPRTRGNEEDRAIDIARRSVLSDEQCDRKIKIWYDRINQLKYNNFQEGSWEDIYNDNKYKNIYARLNSVKSEIGDLYSEMERFDKFVNFEPF